MPCRIWSRYGIIPACAGNTSTCCCKSERTWDHPRMRGEHSSIVNSTYSGMGSSPHARGTPVLAWRESRDAGIIPACAGNTVDVQALIGNVWDHPRMRGEHRPYHPRLHQFRGSSPHARGTRCACHDRQDGQGIIPACAGNTPRPIVRRWWYQDHPRMRGEHSSRTPAFALKSGSSPHARGTLPAEKLRIFTLGIIPACAGNTCSDSWRRANRRDHPRMRGEHSSSLPGSEPKSGSSPHARGTRHHPGGRVAHRGIIPACAGNTIL